MSKEFGESAMAQVQSDRAASKGVRCVSCQDRQEQLT